MDKPFLSIGNTVKICFPESTLSQNHTPYLNLLTRINCTGSGEFIICLYKTVVAYGTPSGVRYHVIGNLYH